MNVLGANLKHLVQKRSLFFFALMMAGLFSAFIVGLVRTQKFSLLSELTIIMFSVGSLMAALPVEVLTRPFAYCLPGHVRVPRRYLFCTGAIACVMEVLCLMLFDPAVRGNPEIIPAVFAAASIFFWLGAWVVLKSPPIGASAAGLPMFVFVGYLFLNGPDVLATLIVKHWIFVILAGIGTNAWAWLCWDREGLARRFCGTIWFGNMFDSLGLSNEQRAKQVRAMEAKKQGTSAGMILPRVETFFLSRMAAAKPGSLGLYAWGNLYDSFAAVFSNLIRNWWGFVVLLIVAGYLQVATAIAFGEALLLPYMLFNRPPVLFIPAGRYQRFCSVMVSAAIVSAFSIGSAFLFACLTNSLAHIMPSLSIAGHSVTYQPVILFFLPVIPLLLPTAILAGLLQNRKVASKQILLWFYFAASFFLILLVIKLHTAILIGVLCLLGILNLLLFVLLVRHYFMRRDLIQN